MAEFHETCEGVQLYFAFAGQQNADWTNRLRALGRFLRTTALPTQIVHIYAYRSDFIGGIRIAEVDFVTASGGSSYMRSDRDTAAVILECEKFLETYGAQPYRPEGWKSYINEHGDSRLNLLESMGYAADSDFVVAERQRQAVEEQELDNRPNNKE